MFHGLAWLNHTLSVYLCDGWTSNFNKNMSQFVLWSNLQSSKVSCVLLPPLLATDLGTLGNHGKRGWVKLETGLRRIWDVWWMVLVALCFPMIFRLWYDLFKSIYICCLMYLSVIVLTMLVVNRLDLLSFFFSGWNFGWNPKYARCIMMCIRPLSFNPGIGNEPAGSLFSKPT